MKEPMLVHSKLFADVGVIGVRIWGLKLVSEANQREHYMAKYKRAKVQQTVVFHALRGLDPIGYLGGPLKITIVRQGPRALDDDNLAGAGKHVRDQIAQHIWGGRMGQRDDLAEWHYEQRKGKYSVEIRFQAKARGAA